MPQMSRMRHHVLMADAREVLGKWRAWQDSRITDPNEALDRLWEFADDVEAVLAEAAAEAVAKDARAREGVPDTAFDAMVKTYMKATGWRWPEVDLYENATLKDGVLREGAFFTVRQYDGMDGCWCDLPEATGVTAKRALETWMRKTKNGTEKTSFDHIDYYAIFQAETKMQWDGGPGGELHR